MNLERHQVKHVISNLVIGDEPRTFAYRGIAVTVVRLVNGYDVSTARGVREVRSRSLHKNMCADVMNTVEELTA